MIRTMTEITCPNCLGKLSLTKIIPRNDLGYRCRSCNSKSCLFILKDSYVKIRKYNSDEEYTYWYCYHREVITRKMGVLPKGVEIHHKDRNRYNNNVNNLVLVRKEQHDKIHNYKRRCNVIDSKFRNKGVVSRCSFSRVKIEVKVI